MPNEYSTFGVLPADIGRYLPRIAFSPTTQPTDTQAVDIIDDHAADLCGAGPSQQAAGQPVNGRPPGR